MQLIDNKHYFFYSNVFLHSIFYSYHRGGSAFFTLPPHIIIYNLHTILIVIN